MPEVFSSTLAWRRRLGFGDFVRWTRRHGDKRTLIFLDLCHSLNAPQRRAGFGKICCGHQILVIAQPINKITNIYFAFTVY